MIKLVGVFKKFDDYTALNNLCLHVQSGEIYGLLGSNGAGKSTTLNLILGFLNADTGFIDIGDDSNNSSFKKDMIGYIPENVNLYPYLSGVENLDYFCKLSGFEYNKNELSDFLNECGLQKEAHHKLISTYSKGMRQKVGIAIAYDTFFAEEIKNGTTLTTTQDLNFFSSFIKDFSKDMPFFYGLFSIMFAVILGIGAAYVRRAISKFRKKYFTKPVK